MEDKDERRNGGIEATEENHECFVARKALEKEGVRTAEKWTYDEVGAARSEVIKLVNLRMQKKSSDNNLDFVHKFKIEI